MIRRRVIGVTAVQNIHRRDHVTGTEAAEIVGITYRRLAYLDRIGVASPTVAAAGQGTRRGYSLDDLVRVRLAADIYDLKNAPVEATIEMCDVAIGALNDDSWSPISIETRFGSVVLLLDVEDAHDRVNARWTRRQEGNDR